MTDQTQDLRELTSVEVELVETHPLPEGVPDALVNKAQLEVGLGVSGTTISNWLRRPDNPLPFEDAGTNGRSYQFRLSVAFAWMKAMRAEEESAKAAGDAATAQLSMALLGGESAAGSSGKMSLSDQRKLIELEALRRVEATNRRELVWMDDVVAAFEAYNETVRDALDALPDKLARALGLEGRDLEKVERVCDDVLEGAESKIGELIDNGESE
ncbi:DUF1441 family protein [Epibacterium sp. SM1979]|uniref:DUF1441 family protein n=1 Tax=Tritonibacter litoralis TaxID=2662264 RepID=A0A843YIW9_9RHOB|nr:DUF1441 family protein [Tritonibacter litoralis]MQQ09099.1 DUF1441 family protein [Tritonibacter litoralis]